MSTRDEQELALIKVCLRHGYNPAIVSLALDDMKRRDAAGGGPLMDTLTPSGKRLGECTGEDLDKMGALFGELAKLRKEQEMTV